MQTNTSLGAVLAQRFYRHPAFVGMGGLGDAIPGGDSNLLYTGTDSPPLPAPPSGADTSTGDDSSRNWPVLIAVLAAGVLLAGLLREK